MKPIQRAALLLTLFLSNAMGAGAAPRDGVPVPISDGHIVYSPYNWFKSGTRYAQSPNPGAYLKLGFTGTKINVNLDVSPFTVAGVPAVQYPLIRYSVDGRPAKTVQLTPDTRTLSCAEGLAPANHNLLVQYVSGYVFLDFWSPVNVIRVTGFELDKGASTLAPSGQAAALPKHLLFLGDSITNGDDDVATFTGGITNAVDTQDATLGYPALVAAGLRAEYGIVAYGGASWDRGAADGHTPGLLTFHAMLDRQHSRLVEGKLFPVPDEIYVNMGENSGPTGEDVPKLLASLRAASGPQTNLFVLIPFSGRSRAPLTQGIDAYRKSAPADTNVFLIDLGNNPYLTLSGPTMMSVDGQHPLAALHAILAAQIVHERAVQLVKSKGAVTP